MKKNHTQSYNPCSRCPGHISRRHFLKQCGTLMTAAGAGLTLAGLPLQTACAKKTGDKVYLSSPGCDDDIRFIYLLKN